MLAVKTKIAGFLCLLCIVAHSFCVSFSTPSQPLSGSPVYMSGWSGEGLPDVDEADKKLVSKIPDEWRGEGEGQTRLLFQDYAAVYGSTYEPREQGKAPSCVGQALAAAVDFLAAVEIHSFKEAERAPPGLATACTIYGLSRQEIGELGPNKGGGSHNLWACKAIQQYGVIARLRYPLIREDLREPSAARAIKYGRQGIPKSLELIAKIHPVKDYVAIDSYEDLRDAIALGYPVVIGSRQGFGSGRLKRDSEGFLNPPFRIFRPSRWNHSMVCIGVCDVGRKGALMLNSWGVDWIYGPDRFPNTPKGCFFVDASIIDTMVEQGDSYAILGYKGYADYRIFR